jgi:hypothetical protein
MALAPLSTLIPGTIPAAPALRQNSVRPSLLPNRFIKQNHAADEFAGTVCGKQNFTIHPPVLLVRRHIDAFQSLLDRPRTFIGCQNPLARRDQFSCYRFQIVSFHASSPYRWVLLLSIIATNKFVASLKTLALHLIERQPFADVQCTAS